MIITFAASLAIGVATAVVLVPIYWLAFQTAGYRRLAWLLPIAVVFWLSFEACLWLANRHNDNVRLAAIVVWLVALIGSAYWLRRTNASRTRQRSFD